MYKKFLKDIYNQSSNKSNQPFLTRKVDKKQEDIDLINLLYSKLKRNKRITDFHINDSKPKKSTDDKNNNDKSRSHSSEPIEDINENKEDIKMKEVTYDRDNSTVSDTEIITEKERAVEQNEEETDSDDEEVIDINKIDD